MKFTLPELPYAHNALEPIISEKTIAFHYGKQALFRFLRNLSRPFRKVQIPVQSPMPPRESSLKRVAKRRSLNVAGPRQGPTPVECYAILGAFDTSASMRVVDRPLSTDCFVIRDDRHVPPEVLPPAFAACYDRCSYRPN